MKTLKQNLLKWLIVAILAFVAFCTKAQVANAECTSLADETGEMVSLWDALAAHHNVDPTEWTISTFRQHAAVYAASVGLVYDKSGRGNVAIVHSLLCAKAVSTSAIETTEKNGRYADDQFDNNIDGVVISSDTIAHGSVVALDSANVASTTSSMLNPLAGINTVDVVGPTCDSVVTITDTVHTVEVVEAMFCDCSSSRSLTELWEDYMVKLPRAIRKEKDAGQRALLAGCREKIGRIVRSEHRYGGRLINDSTNVRDIKHTKQEDKSMGSASPIFSLPVEFCGLTSNLFLGVKTAEKQLKVAAKAAKIAKMKKSNDLAQAKAKRGWKRFVLWLKRVFGSPCRK